MARRPDPKVVLRAGVFLLAGFIVASVAWIGVTAVTMPGCEWCHDRGEFRAESMQSTHSDIECGVCHGADSVATRFTFASRTAFGMVVPIVPAGGRVVSNVEDRVCLGCHASVLVDVVASKGYRIEHAPCTAGRRCVDCHAGIAHGESVRWMRTTQMDDCLECHPADKVRRTCDMCHHEHSPRERLGFGVWRVTHGANWPETHGMGDNHTCAGCHVREYCEPCHGIPLPHDSDYLRTHGAQAIAEAATCDRCHVSEYCNGCHAVEMPHTPAFTQGHGEIAEMPDDQTCYRCHLEADCSTCHETHDRHLDQLGLLEASDEGVGE